MLTILQQLLVLYIFLFLGWLFGKRKAGLEGQSGMLSFLLVTLFLPCKVFGTFSENFTVRYLRENYVTIFLSVGLLLLLVLLAKLAAPMLTKDAYERRVYRYSLAISNYAYMGYVLVEELFGVQGLTNLILFCIPFALYTYTFGYAMLTGKGNMLKKLCNPLTAAILLGMVFGLTGIPMPAVITKVLSSSAACVGPVSMLLTGVVLSGFSLKELVTDRTAYVFSALRLVVLPLGVFGLCKLLGMLVTLPEAVYPSAVIMACMPCGLNTVVFPKLVGEDCRIGARLALLSHLFSCITIPIWLSVLM